MSPEQARGENATLDARSDLYSAAVVFQELLCLRHYLDDRQTLEDMLRGVSGEEFNRMLYMTRSAPGQSAPPPELLQFLFRAMQKKPEDRFQSAREMIDRLEGALDGRVYVQCPFTFTKRVAREAARFVDRHPFLAVATLFCAVLGVLASLVLGLRALLLHA
jgi:serine/threonine-protein kinase